MQITLNKIAFEVRAVDGPLRAALLAEPAIAPAVRREVWAWDGPGAGAGAGAGAGGRFLVPVTDRQGIVLPTGLTVFIPVANGSGVRRADGPTRRMAERLLAAIGAKSFAQVMQAFARVAGLPQKTVPFEAFAGLNAHGAYRILQETDFAVLELANPARNLAAYAFVPGLVAFSHAMEPVEGAAVAGSIRPGFVIPPPTQAAMTMRRMATAKRLNELQADLAGTRPADLAPGDPRRDVIARLAAEWRVLQPKAREAVGA